MFTAETLVTAEPQAALAGLFMAEDLAGDSIEDIEAEVYFPEIWVEGVNEFSVVSGIEFKMSARILTGGLQKVME